MNIFNTLAKSTYANSKYQNRFFKMPILKTKMHFQDCAKSIRYIRSARDVRWCRLIDLIYLSRLIDLIYRSRLIDLICLSRLIWGEVESRLICLNPENAFWFLELAFWKSDFDILNLRKLISWIVEKCFLVFRIDFLKMRFWYFEFVLKISLNV